MPEPPTAVNHAAVIARSTRDPETFAALYDRHAAALHRYVATLKPGTGP